MNSDTAVKIKLLEDSQQCLAYGLISLVTLIGVPFAILSVASREPGNGNHPFSNFCFCLAVLSMVGLPFAVLAIVASVKARSREKNLWNAARTHRIMGGLCALLAVVASFVIVALTGFLILNNYLYGE